MLLIHQLICCHQSNFSVLNILELCIQSLTRIHSHSCIIISTVESDTLRHHIELAIFRRTFKPRLLSYLALDGAYSFHL